MQRRPPQIPDRRTLMSMRLILIAALAAAGCSRSSRSEDVTTSAANSVAVPPSITGPAVQGSQEHASRHDIVLARAVAPDTPALPPVERFTLAPRPRETQPHIPELDVVARSKLAPLPVIPPRLVGFTPAPPAERVPPDLGNGSQAVPAKPNLPVAKAATKRSRDVNLPPPLPMLGRRVGDRVGFDDPTADLGNAAIVQSGTKVPYASSPFLKMGIPDPFELAEQIRATIPREHEPGLTPVGVNPRRVK
jgi:hypothetical protein